MSCMSMRLIPRGSLLLAGAWVRDITRTLPGLIQHTDYYTLMIVQMGSDKDVWSWVGINELRGVFQCD